MSINLIAKDSLSNVINFTSPDKPENANYCLVSKLWNDVASGDPVWRLIADREGVKIAGTSDSTIKELFWLLHSRKITSNDEIIIRFHQFLDRCSIDQNCRFRCVLGLGSRQGHLTVEIGKFKKDLNSLPQANFISPHKIDIREDYFCVNGLGDCDLSQFLPPNTSSIIEIRDCESFTTNCFFSKLNYSHPTYPRETRYPQLTHIWNDSAITISFPIHHANDNDFTPLLRQIESMATSKLGKCPLSGKQACINAAKELVYFASVMPIAYLISSVISLLTNI